MASSHTDRRRARCWKVFVPESPQSSSQELQPDGVQRDQHACGRGHALLLGGDGARSCGRAAPRGRLGLDHRLRRGGMARARRIPGTVRHSTDKEEKLDNLEGLFFNLPVAGQRGLFSSFASQTLRLQLRCIARPDGSILWHFCCG